MASRKGFSLIEILIVLIILGVMASMIISYVVNSMAQTSAQAAKSNLLAISAAQQKYFEDYNSYCTATTGNVAPHCGDSLTTIDNNLKLTISPNDPYAYSCADGGTVPDTYLCTATFGAITLTTTGSTVTCAPAGNSICPS